MKYNQRRLLDVFEKGKSSAIDLTPSDLFPQSLHLCIQVSTLLATSGLTGLSSTTLFFQTLQPHNLPLLKSQQKTFLKKFLYFEEAKLAK